MLLTYKISIMKLVSTMMFSPKRIFVTLSFLLVYFLSWSQVNYTWTGASTQEWSNTSNWSPSGTPGINDTVNLNGGTIQAPADQKILIAGIHLNGGKLTITDTLILIDEMEWTGGTINGSGVFVVDAGSILNISSNLDHTLLGVKLANLGILSWTGEGDWILSTASIVENSGLMELSNNSTLSWGGGSFPEINNLSTGIIRKLNPESLTTLGNFLKLNNDGLIEVLEGSLEIYSNGISNGTLEVKNSSFLKIGTAEQVWNPGSLLKSNGDVEFYASGPTYVTNFGGTYKVDGKTHIRGAYISFSGDVISFGDSLEFSGGKFTYSSDSVHIPFLEINSGDFYGTGTIFVDSSFTWRGGRLFDAGNLIIDSAANCLFDSETDLQFQSRKLYNYGTLTWRGPGNILFGGSPGPEIHNRGTFEIRNSASLLSSGVPPKIINHPSGIIRKTGDVGTTLFTTWIQFENEGLLDISSGTLNLECSGTYAGKIHSGDSTLLNFAAGNHAFADSVDLMINGDLSITGAYLNLSNDFTFPPGTFFEKGEIRGMGSLTVSDTMFILDGTFKDTAELIIDTSGVLVLKENSNMFLWQRSLHNYGNISFDNGKFTITSNAMVNNEGIFTLSGNAQLLGGSFGMGGKFPEFNNLENGIFVADGTNSNNQHSAFNFNNYGEVIIRQGTFDITGSISNGQFTQYGGSMLLDYGHFTSPVDLVIEGGELKGDGYIHANVINKGLVDPGFDTTTFGIIFITGDYRQDTSGILSIDIGGYSPRSGYDQLTTNTASLAGLLDINFKNELRPDGNARYWVVRWLESSFQGKFDSISNLSSSSHPGTELIPAYTVNDLTLYGKDEDRDMWIQLIGRKMTRPGKPQKIKMYYGAYNRDTLVVPLMLTLKGEMYLKPENQYVHYPDWVPWEAPVDKDYFENNVPDIFPKDAGVYKIPILITIPPKEGNIGIGSSPQAGTSYMELLATPKCNGESASATADAGLKMDAGMEDCLWGVANELVGFLPGGACVQGGIKLVMGGFQQYSKDLNGKPQTWGNFLAGMGWDLGKCAVSFLPGGTLVTKTADALGTIMDGVGQAGVVNDCAGVLMPKPYGKKAATSVSCVNSMDPNEKAGPEGYTDLKFHSGTNPSVFSIYFENVDSATAAAQNVYITDQLIPEHWDFSSFSFLPISVGDTTFNVPPYTPSFEIEVDLRPANDLLLLISGNLDEASGLIRWTFTSLDTLHHQPVTDPLAGFLPPNVNHPEGQGDVGYLVQPNLDLSTGTGLGSHASIIFDSNEPILTNAWINHIDREAPSSHMDAFSATLETGEIPLAWSGQDNHSGIRNYILYVSKDEQPFEEVLASSDTSYLFTGDSCSSYRFYTVGIDSVGNREANKDPEVMVTVNPYQSIEISLGGAAEICQGDSVLLRCMSDTALSYTWYRNGSALENMHDSIIYVKETGAYTLNVERNEACTGSSDPVNITSNSLPEISVSLNVNILSAPEDFQNYQWYHNDVLIQDANNFSLAANKDGEYSVRVTDTKGCMQTSDPVGYLAVQAVNLQAGKFQVYPNPTNDWITFRIPEKLRSTDLYISILDLNGRYILKSIKMDIHNNETSIHIGQYADGIYNYIIEERVSGKQYTGQFIME